VEEEEGTCLANTHISGHTRTQTLTHSFTHTHWKRCYWKWPKAVEKKQKPQNNVP